MWFYMKYIVKNRGWRILMSMDCTFVFFCIIITVNLDVFRTCFAIFIEIQKKNNSQRKQNNGKLQEKGLHISDNI